MWTTENRCRRNRDKLRYVSEVADAGWTHVAPLNPRGKRTVSTRDAANAVTWVLGTRYWSLLGCAIRINANGAVVSFGDFLNVRKVVRHEEIMTATLPIHKRPAGYISC